ncbi:hypothetical protein CFR73_10100 [Novacetimonas maltaceti]|uniref:DUF3325 domain-containing protein n=1 Tax=Novacetimonas maltaceti TaxID=1203393 RepID=A0A2S3W257_9PROT|nr:hypothetical protein [Novacetimonas maltaceti]POF62984.1 hypothetical protein KMAL_13590 [Novacetimonas maltaceti]PYD59757.1 hypothetical protein CFR73_10100 [Novacetimonas maltaceti]
MMIPCLVLLWACCLACHAGLHCTRYRLPGVPARYRPMLRVIRAGTPALALGTALTDGVVGGVLLWCATFSIAGLLVAAGIAAWSARQRR